ncbi:hypothetical protein BVG79_00505 [Ketogulonicigenium robustum]|uniref:Uncharacterized protein n=1 Tax=Ketogulonicigenium robustum TaxID=92947 RepID=A0A1W6NXW4_9RHOB|nr:hypothetical protein [Ketogulonicigenium robustum]ARO13857.1 hypothetical protein BVG79_00505 [Ketogulonicigenium robustum]
MDTPTPAERPFLRWATIIGLAVLIAYAASPLTSALVAAASLTASADIGLIPVVVIQLIALIAALIWLARISGTTLRISRGLIATGALFLLALPAVIITALVGAALANDGDPGGPAAAVFMVIIFGGFYGLIGAGFIFGGLSLRKPAPKDRL